GTPRCRTASPAVSSMRRARSSSSDSARARRCVTASSRPSRGTETSRAIMRARSAARVAVDKLRRADPALLLAALALAQLAVAAWLAFSTSHNGWVWYSGGDATEYWTAQWSIAHGWIPQSVIGWGLPVFYA